MKQTPPSSDMTRIVDLSEEQLKPSPPAAADPYATGADARRGVTAVLDSMVRNTEERERSFEKALRDQVARHTAPVAAAAPAAAAPPAAATVAPAEPTSDPEPPSLVPTAEPDHASRPVTPVPPEATLPAPRVDVEFGMFTALGRPGWSQSKLEYIGMPPVLLERTKQLEPAADFKWIEALVRAATPVCAPVVEASSLLMSCDHTALAGALGLPIHRPGELPPYGGSIFCLVDDLESARDWLDRIKGDRMVHVMLSDDRSEQLLELGPAAVSYASEMGAARALRTALVHEIPLTFGVTHDGEPIRATPLDVALSIRSWMRQ